jgi:hypothetical protein
MTRPVRWKLDRRYDGWEKIATVSRRLNEGGKQHNVFAGWSQTQFFVVPANAGTTTIVDLHQ